MCIEPNGFMIPSRLSKVIEDWSSAEEDMDEDGDDVDEDDFSDSCDEDEEENEYGEEEEGEAGKGNLSLAEEKKRMKNAKKRAEKRRKLKEKKAALRSVSNGHEESKVLTKKEEMRSSICSFFF